MLEAPKAQRSSKAGPVNGPSKRRFDQLFQDGLRANGVWCRVHLLPGNGLLGIATAKAIGCHAWRNRQKRRIRAAIPSSENLKKFDLVISVKAAARQAPFTEIQAEIQKLIGDLALRWENESACP